MKWHHRLVGVPYAIEGGAGDTLEHLHCWGLVRAAFRLAKDVELPSHDDIAPQGLRSWARVMGGSATASEWAEVSDQWQELDVILMASRDGSKRYPTHCGIVTPEGLILHTEAHHSAVIVRPDHASVRNRIYGAYRHASLFT